jgi:hypothetical protein
MAGEGKTMFDTSVAVVSGIEREEVRRAQLFQTISLTTTIGAAAVLVFFLASEAIFPLPSFRYMIAVTTGYFALSALSMWIGRRGDLTTAIAIFMANTIGGMFLSSYLFNGTTGPLPIVLAAIPMVAGLLGGRRSAYWMAVIVGALYLLMALLELLDVIHPLQVSGLVLLIVSGGLFVATLAIVGIVAGMSFELTQTALSLALQRTEDLISISGQAEQAARAERDAREREERSSHQLRRTAQDYIAFMEQVRSGNYEARLELQDSGQDPIGSELATLGRYINNTVESLVAALGDLQAIQRQRTAESWRSHAETGLGQLKFHSQGSDGDAASAASQQIHPDRLDEALRTRAAAADRGEMALPILLHGEPIGAVGLLRRGEAEWTEEEVTLAEGIMDQLAQTIESLRLLDETQRQAAREQLTSEFATRIRETLDMETILQTAVRELGETIGLAEVEVRMMSGN